MTAAGRGFHPAPRTFSDTSGRTRVACRAPGQATTSARRSLPDSNLGSALSAMAETFGARDGTRAPRTRHCDVGLATRDDRRPW